MNECIGVGLERNTEKGAKRSHKTTETMIKQEPRGRQERRRGQSTVGSEGNSIRAGAEELSHKLSH